MGAYISQWFVIPRHILVQYALLHTCMLYGCLHCEVSGRGVIDDCRLHRTMTRGGYARTNTQGYFYYSQSGVYH